MVRLTVLARLPQRLGILNTTRTVADNAARFAPRTPARTTSEPIRHGCYSREPRRPGAGTLSGANCSAPVSSPNPLPICSTPSARQIRHEPRTRQQLLLNRQQQSRQLTCLMNATRETAFQAGMPHQGGQPRSRSRRRMNTLDVGSMITPPAQRAGCAVRGCCGRVGGRRSPHAGSPSRPSQAWGGTVRDR
jgi:hypothetical protein